MPFKQEPSQADLTPSFQMHTDLKHQVSMRERLFQRKQSVRGANNNNNCDGISTFGIKEEGFTSLEYQ